MKPWIQLHQTTLPSGDVLSLHRRDKDFVIRVNNVELMNSRAHGSEDALATLASQALGGHLAPRVLIGGLGMGFTLTAALRTLPADARVIVAELVPEVVDWNRGAMAELTQWALDDPRTTVHIGDVQALIERPQQRWDAILLDIDNGPEGLTQASNDVLYQLPGLRSLHDALNPGGVLAIWSVSLDPAFTRRLKEAGFKAKPHSVHAHGTRGRRHLVWIGRRF